MTIASATLLLVLVMDPVGNVPFFLAALSHVDPRRRRRVVVRELLIALAVLVLFLLAGRHILLALHVSQPSLYVAGGIILFLISLRMVFPSQASDPAERDEEPLIVPLAIPAVAGPSAIATVLLLVSQAPHRTLDWLVALLLAWAMCAAMLLGGNALSRFLGRRGLLAMERLMGMLLTIVAVEMFLVGIGRFMSTPR